MPYAWVPEFHADGSRFHLHFAVNRYVRKSLVAQVWGRGIVDMRRIDDVPVGAGRLGEARVAAGYLSKYLGKSFSDVRIANRHRYDVAQGFQPERIPIWGTSAQDVVEKSTAYFEGAFPSWLWNSSEAEEWFAPPAIAVRWT
ncbi:hypothetical protein NOCARDAX2BIS_390033 [Nocardioides sp. AX2bis]|nr:hypothetical protein NOCARDAX2BIS_390033 [Nocardioides sp. AX2bis]